MDVLFVAMECTPFFKTGGLADVIGSLPLMLNKKQVNMSVVLPLHSVLADRYRRQLVDVTHFYVKVGWRNQYCGVKKLVRQGVTYYFLENDYYFKRETIYGYYEDGERFAYFCQAVLKMLEKLKIKPDIIHLNDFHTAMISVLLQTIYKDSPFHQSIKTVLTIHNIGFQGDYEKDVLSDLFSLPLDLYRNGKLVVNGNVNFLKAGILYSDKITTVSPTYAQEIQTLEYGEGLHHILAEQSYKLTGILNGIDTSKYNPQTDSQLAATFSVESLDARLVNKSQLQSKLNLPLKKHVPLLAVVSRLTIHKGLPFIISELAELVKEDIQFVILGRGDRDIEFALSYFAKCYPEKVSVNLDFDEALAQQIYAASDLFLMPSLFEPCGLSQMIAMRYGSIPIVHEVGGLKDTVIAYNQILGTGTGFGFVDYSSMVFSKTLKRALHLYRRNPSAWQNLMKQAMSAEFSWSSSSNEYLTLYQEVLSTKKGE